MLSLSEVRSKAYEVDRKLDKVATQYHRLRADVSSCRSMYVTAYKAIRLHCDQQTVKSVLHDMQQPFKAKLQTFAQVKAEYKPLRAESDQLHKWLKDPCYGCTAEACPPTDENGDCPLGHNYVDPYRNYD